MPPSALRIADLDFAQLAALLALPLEDDRLIAFLGPLASRVERDRDSYYAGLSLPEQGVELVFKEAPWVLPPERIVDEKALHLAAFHFHSAGHHEHSGYAGRLLGDIAFGDSEFDIRRKLGEPYAKGGGVGTVMPNFPIPRWRKYRLGTAILHLQLDDIGRLEMVTLLQPDARPGAG